MDRPAPLWYRRFSNAMIFAIIPAASSFVEDWGLGDVTEKRLLHGFIFLAALIKGIGLMLGNGQNYTAEKVGVWLLFLTLFLSGCRSEAEIAKSEAIKAERARQKEKVQLQKVREQLPCIPLKIIQGQTVYLPGDSVPCTAGKCPPMGIRVDTLKILDEAAIKAVRDSLEQAIYITELKDTHILQLQAEYGKQLARADKEVADKKYWRRIVLWGTGVIAAGFCSWLLFAGKLSFISKAFSWLTTILR